MLLSSSEPSQTIFPRLYLTHILLSQPPSVLGYCSLRWVFDKWTIFLDLVSVFSISSAFSFLAFRSPLELQNLMARYASPCVILFNSIPVILNLFGILIPSCTISDDSFAASLAMFLAPLHSGVLLSESAHRNVVIADHCLNLPAIALGRSAFVPSLQGIV